MSSKSNVLEDMTTVFFKDIDISFLFFKNDIKYASILSSNALFFVVLITSTIFRNAVLHSFGEILPVYDLLNGSAFQMSV
jgi:hypothetical protein